MLLLPSDLELTDPNLKQRGVVPPLPPKAPKNSPLYSPPDGGEFETSQISKTPPTPPSNGLKNSPLYSPPSGGEFENCEHLMNLQSFVFASILYLRAGSRIRQPLRVVPFRSNVSTGKL